MASARKITLKSSDDQVFIVDETVASELKTIKLLFSDGCVDGVIPLENVTGKILGKLIEYCTEHTSSKHTSSEKNLKDWDAQFVKVDLDTLFDLINAANYLNIPSLLDLTCQTVADKMRDKTPEEVRNFFNIKNDLTPAQEEELREEEKRWEY